MSASDELSRLSARAKQAEDRAAAAKVQARAQLEQAIREAGDSAHETAEKMRTASAESKERTDAGVDKVRRSWNEHLADVRARQEAAKTRHKADRAEFEAEDAESYAEFSIDLAYSAIEEAEYAVLDAVLAREDADSAAQTVSS
jgi:hypothetical protein